MPSGRSRSSSGRCAGNRVPGAARAGARCAGDPDAVRELSERLREDRPLAEDIERVAEAIREGSTIAAAEAEIGELE